MSTPQRKQQLQEREARLELVGELYKKGYSIRQICKEILAQGLRETISPNTVKNDIDLLLRQWREDRVNNIDLIKQLELERIDTIIQECWRIWKKTEDVSFFTEMGRQLVERRKLLGLYEPEKKEFQVNKYDLQALTPDQQDALLSIGEQIINKGANGK